MAKKHAGLGVKARDGCHLAVGEPEIEDVQVFFHALLVRGLGQSDDVALSEPTQDHLRDGLAMYLANLWPGWDWRTCSACPPRTEPMLPEPRPA